MSFLKGEVEIVKREAHWDELTQKWIPGKVVDVIKKNNLISHYYQYVLGNYITLPATHWDIYLSEARVKMNQNHTDGLQGVDAGNAGTWFPRDPVDPREPVISPAYFLWRETFDPPSGSSRYISAISLRNGTSVEQIAAVLALTELCEQTTSQILDVFYRVYVDDTTAVENIDVSKVVAFEQLASMFSGAEPDAASRSFRQFEMGFDWWRSTPDLINCSESIYNTDVLYTIGSGFDAVDGVYDASVSTTTTQRVGNMYGSVMGYNDAFDQALVYRTDPTPLLPEDTSSMQSTFPKLKSSLLPFLDISNPATGTGTMLVSEDTPGVSWEPADHQFAELYRILITASGDVGTSTYKLAKMIVPSLRGNVFSSELDVAVPTLPGFSGSNFGTSAVSFNPSDRDTIRYGVSGKTLANCSSSAILEDESPYLISYNYPEWLSAGVATGDIYEDAAAVGVRQGVTIYDMQNRILNLDSTTTPPLPVTDILQMETDTSGNIYVACADTGLWKIVRAAATDLGDGYSTITSITKITVAGAVNDAACRGVTIEKTAGVATALDTIWAIFDQEIGFSTDGGTNWTVYNEATTPAFILSGVTGAGDASGIMHLHKDHHHANDRFFISWRTNPATATGEGWWWGTEQVTDTPGGNGQYVNITAGITVSFDSASYRRVGSKCIYAGSDEGWFFSVEDSNQMILRYPWNGTGNAPYQRNTTISCVTGAGIMVHFDENGDDWIIGYDETNSSIERVRGKRPANALSTSATGSKVICWRVNNASGAGYETYVGGLQCYVGKGFWIASVGFSQPDTGYRYYKFIQSNDGGMDATGVVTDPNVWEEYGWDGGAWVLDNVNSKTTHSSTDALIDGLSIDFTTDGNLATSFLDTDMYDAWAFKGLIKDNATIFDYSGSVTRFPSVAGSDFVGYDGTTAATVVPSTSPGLITAELTNIQYLEEYTRAGEPGTSYNALFAGSNSQDMLQFGETYIGDFTIEFNMNTSRTTSNGGLYTSYGMQDASFKNSTAPTFIGAFTHDDAFNADDLTIRIVVRDGDIGGSEPNLGQVDVLQQKTNPLGDDYFLNDIDYRIVRTGPSITYDYREKNGAWTTVYTDATAGTADMIFGCSWNNEHHNIIYNARSTYTDSTRKYVFIGNGTTTGPGNHQNADGTRTGWPDENYRSMGWGEWEKVVIEVSDDGGTTYDRRTQVNDWINGPDIGEVQVTKSGKVIFNNDDDGKPFRGSWTYIQVLNKV